VRRACAMLATGTLLTIQAALGGERTTHPEAQWFGEAGLGLFIHWGISSVHGGIDLSWGMMAGTPWDAGRNKVTPEEYFALADRFRPDRYDPARWLAAAAQAGFRYAVLTTRHHDGYALWPSAYGEFGVKTHLGGRDLVRPFVEACRKAGLKVGLYYSPPDWYWSRRYMSFNYGSDGDAKPHFGLRHEPVVLPSRPAGWDAAFRAYVRGQVTELLTRYGRIDLIWFDGGPDAISIEEIRKLQPWIVINPRMHGWGDFQTPECRMPEAPIEGWWELCEIWPEGPWGYTTGHEKYRPVGWLLSRLAQVRSWGGNYLINVAPRPTGELPDAYYERMRELAAWMRRGGESIFGVGRGPYPARSNVPVTVRGKTWYAHVLAGSDGRVELKDVQRPISAKLLRTGAELGGRFAGGSFTVELPREMRTDLDDVIAVAW